MNKRNAKYAEHATYQITCHSLSLLVQYQWVRRLIFNRWTRQQCPIKCTPYESKRKIVLSQQAVAENWHLKGHTPQVNIIIEIEYYDY